MMQGRIVALDVGDVRIGIAVCDEMRLIATPHSVYKRVGFGPLTLGDLKRGEWRDLTPEEVAKLRDLDA